MDWVLLKKVSRSFYLTLRILPVSVRESVALAYVLARLTDTKADGAVTPAEQELLRREAELSEALRTSFDRDVIDAVWKTIQAGQAFDRERFAGNNAAPLTEQELDNYTYMVAGCVGEFWTRICAKHLPSFSRLSLSEMTTLGIEYGKGLQLINILRDRAADRDLGRIYLSETQVTAALTQARAYLDSGKRYVQALKVGRLRVATALPLLIGRETLDLIEAQPGTDRVKVSRGRIWVILLRSLFF